MDIKNVSEFELNQALEIVNTKFNGNVEFNRKEKSGKRFKITLRVTDSSGAGARRGFTENEDGTYRKMINACWHVHGEFFDALLNIQPKAIITTSIKQQATKVFKDANGDIQNNWIDWNIGSFYRPYYYSEACEC